MKPDLTRAVDVLMDHLDDRVCASDAEAALRAAQPYMPSVGVSKGEALARVLENKLLDPEGTEWDNAYDEAVGDCADTIRDLPHVEQGLGVEMEMWREECVTVLCNLMDLDPDNAEDFIHAKATLVAVAAAARTETGGCWLCAGRGEVGDGKTNLTAIEDCAWCEVRGGRRSIDSFGAWHRQYVKTAVDAVEQGLVVVCVGCGGDPEPQGYGMFPGGDPRRFDPDPEVCTTEEMNNHKAACVAWDRGEGVFLGPSCATMGDGSVYTGTGYGMGTYTLPPCDECAPYGGKGVVPGPEVTGGGDAT